MASNPKDPAASTQQFRAFANRGQSDQSGSGGPKMGVIIGVAAVVAFLVILGIAYMMI